MKEPVFIPFSETELKLRTKIKTFLFCDEDETPSFEDKVIMVIIGVLILWPILLMAIAS